MLLDKRAKVDEPDAEGSTPLHLAAMKGQTEMVGFLLSPRTWPGLSGPVKRSSGRSGIAVSRSKREAAFVCPENKGDRFMYRVGMKGPSPSGS
jgi:ankyrin repeat protein